MDRALYPATQLLRSQGGARVASKDEKLTRGVAARLLLQNLSVLTSKPTMVAE